MRAYWVGAGVPGREGGCGGEDLQRCGLQREVAETCRCRVTGRLGQWHAKASSRLTDCTAPGDLKQGDQVYAVDLPHLVILHLAPPASHLICCQHHHPCLHPFPQQVGALTMDLVDLMGLMDLMDLMDLMGWRTGRS